MTKSVDSTTSQNPSDIPGRWKESVQAIIDLGGQVSGLKKIAQQRGCTKQAVSKHFPDIVDEGIIEKQGDKKPYLYKLTGKGYRTVDNTPYGPGSVDNIVDQDSDSKGSGSEKATRRLHGLTARAEVQGEVLPEKWMGRLKSEERVNFSKVNGGNDTMVWTNRFFLRLHKSSCTVQAREGCDYSASSDIEAFLRFHEDLEDLLKWVRKASGVQVKLESVDLRRAELAFEDHHLAQLVAAVPDLSLSDFTVEDEDLGKDVVTLDDSFGPELETKSGERAEEIGNVVEGEMRQYSERPEAVEKRHELENEMMVQSVSGQEMVHGMRQASEVSGQVQETVTEVKQVQEEVSEMKEVLKDNKETREALHEQVRALNNLAQRNQELIEQEVVQEQENDRPDDLLEETVENVLDEDRFSAPGLQYGHLMVFDTMENECRKILDKSVVSKSDSRYKDLLNVWKGERP